MGKIWTVAFRGGRKYYKSESAFLDAIRDSHTGTSVTIYEEIEKYDDVVEYKKNLILQREREEQLSVILEDNKEVHHLTFIKNEILKCKENWTTKAILKRFTSRGMSTKTLKKHDN